MVSEFRLEIILVAGGLLLAAVGLLLLKDWQKRASILVGALLVVAALMSAMLEVSTSVMWGTYERPTGEPEYVPGTLIPELNEGVPIANLEGPIVIPEEVEDILTPPTQDPLLALPDATEDLSPTQTPGSALDQATPAAERQEVAGTVWATDTPGPTDTPRPPTDTPVATDTAVPAEPTSEPTVAQTASSEPAATSEKAAKATDKPRPTSTPKPIQRRLSLKKLESDLRGVAITTPGKDAQDIIFELRGRTRVHPIYSAAWSPDGRRVVIAYSWQTSQYDQGIRLHVVNADGTGGRNVLDLTTAGLYRGLGNALWSPAGDKIIFAFHDGPNDGVWEIKPDGSELRRLDNSVPGEWPRYWTEDGEWLITISGDGVLSALEVGGNSRLPFSSLEPVPVLDSRYVPWRERVEPRCEKQDDSWWKCK